MNNKFQKIRGMSLGEICFRLKENTITKKEHISYIKNKYFNIKIQKPIKQGETNNIFFTDTYAHKNRVNLQKNFLNLKNNLEQAEQILNGELVLLGENITLTEKTDWHNDPLEFVLWPLKFYTEVQKDKALKLCDIKYIWELNRHQFLVLLGMAYWFTGDEKYAKKAAQYILSWIEENPLNVGVNWTSSLELAVRSISWLWVVSLCRNSQHFGSEFNRQFLYSIYDQCHHIEKHLSLYSSPYNHYIGEAAALHVLGMKFSNVLKRAEKWETLGWEILVQECEKQFHVDGLTVEQATFYHHFTLGFYLQSILLRIINNKDVPDVVLNRVEKALEVSMYIALPDKTLPMIGDIDNARSLFFDLEHSWDFRGLLSLGAVLFKRSDFKHQSPDVTLEMTWLCSDKMIEDFIAMEICLPKETSKAFYSSGYFVSRDTWEDDSNYFCFDCGEIADGLHQSEIPSAAHGHADALSFALSAFGRNFLVDGGFFTYFGELEWHKYFRQEEAHNTVRVGNFRQAEYCGRLTWKKVKSPRLLTWETNSDYDFVAGRIDYSSEVFHERKLIYLKKKFWLVNDFVFSNHNDVESYLHFDPEVELIHDENSKIIVASIGEVGIVIQYFYNAEIQAIKGGFVPSDGWVGQGYGIKKPAWRVELKWEKASNLYLFPMLIVPYRNQAAHVEIYKNEWSSSQGKIDFNSLVDINGVDSSIKINAESNKIALKYGQQFFEF